MGRADDSEARYVVEVVDALWPDRALEVHTRPPLRRLPAGGVDLAVLPSLHRPRLLLPRDPRTAAAALRGYKTSASRRTRWRLRAVALLARLGAVRLLPYVVRVLPDPDGRSGIDGHLADTLGRPVRASIHLGPPRAVRKPVIQLLTPTGRTVGFAKVGTHPLTRALVASEATKLRDLRRERLVCVEAPEVLHHGAWQGLEILVQRALTSTGAEEVPEALLEQAMVEVATVHGIPVALLTEHPYLAGLRARCAALPPSASASALRQTLDAVAGAVPVPVAFGSWHGDWSPWNMAVSDGRVLLWDWEHFGTGVPAGHDALHYRVQELVRTGRPPVAAFAQAFAEAPILLDRFQDEDAVPQVCLLYAADIATRYLHDDEAEGGTSLGDVAAWLAPVLEAQQAHLVVGAAR